MSGTPETVKHNPISNVKWVPWEKIQANDYNPNAVPTNEFKLLYTSIKEDGITQPVVTFWDEEKQKYIIVDGFHRYTALSKSKDLREMNGGLIPIVVIDKDINQRMASTVRHNRARGKHSVAGMGNLVFQMLENGMPDHEICNKMGLSPDELLRLKHLTGFAKLYKDREYSRSFEMEQQIKNRAEYKNKGES